MFGSKPQLKEGTHIFSIKKNGDFNDFIFAVVSGVDGRKVGVNGVIVNPIGLKNKISKVKLVKDLKKFLITQLLIMLFWHWCIESNLKILLMF